MNGVAIVDSAAGMARAMVQREARGPGDTDNAMRRIASRHSIPYRVLWSLRYRQPKDIMASAFLALATAYEAECERQRQTLEQDIAIATAKGGIAAALARAAARVAGEADLTE